MSFATITVREYARLGTEPVGSPSLDCAQVSASAFDWLCQLSASFSRAGASLVQIENRRLLKLDNYVGVIETPCGTRLEILPKHVEEANADVMQRSRRLLCRMIYAAMDLPVREVGQADLALFNAPLHEWVMRQFLQTLDHLLKRGLRFDYLRVEEQQRYLRGQLDVARQVRQPPGRDHLFNIRHDVFVPDRPENRLLKSALLSVCQSTQDPDNWRLAHELRGLLHEVPTSIDVVQDFSRWQNDRLMAHYQAVRPWCELILRQMMPMAVSGEWRGISLLFPMEKLFERYVASWLKQELLPNARLTAQAASQYLCTHGEGRIFRLEPDLLVTQGPQQWVLDTKWKRLDASDREGKYGLSQADFYQLFAYGQKYLGGKGELVLIYPYWPKFTKALPRFNFDEHLQLWVLPFDLEGYELRDWDFTQLPLSLKVADGLPMAA